MIRALVFLLSDSIKNGDITQGARILAELFLKYVDDALLAADINWHRYVDDYVLIANDHAEAYKALGILAHALANYGLSLNKSKTIFLSAKHYKEYVSSQLGDNDEEAAVLRSIDLKFDPYSDNPEEDYESLKETVESLQVRRLLNRELEKSIPDSFLITQIGRTIRLHESSVAVDLVSTLLSPQNLHAFRATWSTIMRGIAHLRSDPKFNKIADRVDILLDQIPIQSKHLLEVDTSLLHYLRCLRFKSNIVRSAFVHRIFNQTKSDTVKRACIDCWRYWEDRNAFTELRNNWNRLDESSQRILWLASYKFDDQGSGMRAQLKASTEISWLLDIEGDPQNQQVRPYYQVFRDWVEGAFHAI